MKEKRIVDIKTSAKTNEEQVKVYKAIVNSKTFKNFYSALTYFTSLKNHEDYEIVSLGFGEEYRVQLKA